MNMWKRVLLIVAIAVSSSFGAESQIIQDGDWIGQIIHRNGRAMEVTYKVRNEEDGLQITLVVKEYGSFQFRDIRVSADSLFFVWKPSFELPCTLALLPDGVYHGLCADPWGGYGGAIMAPPGSDRDALTLDEMTFRSISGLQEDTDSEPEEWRLGEAYPKGNTVTLNGLDVNYIDAGTGPETVVLIAGLGDNLTTWEVLHQSLAQNLRTVAYDRPGLGLSKVSSMPRTPGQMASELRDLLQSINAPAPYLLVAHAEGAFIARQFVDLYTEQVRGLVLIDPDHEKQAGVWKGLDAEAWQSYWSRVKRFQSMLPGGTGQEFKVYAEIIDGQVDPGLSSAPSVPTVILTAKRVSDPTSWIGESSEGRQAWSRFHASWVEKMPMGTHLTLDHGSYIHHERPDKVEEVIHSMLSGK